MKNNKILSIAILGFSVFFFLFAIKITKALPATTVFYVDKNGDDTLCNGTVSTPYSVSAAPNCAYKSIQKGINSTPSGGTVHVGPGLYDERLTINYPITLLGNTSDTVKKDYVVPSAYNFDQSVETIIKPSTDAELAVVTIKSDSVVFKGFVVANEVAGSTGANAVLRDLVQVAFGFDATNGIQIVNNVLGPNTNSTSQTGMNGRSGITVLGPRINPLKLIIEGNRIFDSKGNGCGIMIIGPYGPTYHGHDFSGYLSGSIIRNNNITGNHRSGIEFGGGVQGTASSHILVTDNIISNNGWFGLSDKDTLKYGNGISFQRGGSDRLNADAFGSKYIDIKDNIISNNEKSAAYIGPVNKNIYFSGNIFSNNGLGTGGYSQFYAIYIDMDETYWAAGTAYTTYSQLQDIKFEYNQFITNGYYQGILVTQAPTNGNVIAKYNYWGDPTGPFNFDLNFYGYGDEVSEYVDFFPWYATTTTNTSNQENYIVKDGDTIVAYSDDIDAALAIMDENTSYKLSGNNIAKTATSYEADTGNDLIDDKHNSNVEVEKEGEGRPNVTIVYFSQNPTDGNPGFTTFEDSFIDVHFSQAMGLEYVTIKLWYTDAQVEGIDEGSLYLKYWDGDSWEKASDTGVNTTDTGEYSGYVWATINESTTPDLSYLSGQQFAAGGTGNTVYLPDSGMNIYLFIGISLSLTMIGAGGLLTIKIRQKSI